MHDRPRKVMLVEADAPLVAVIAGSVSARFGAQVTCAVNAEKCLEVELLEPHDLAIVDLDDDPKHSWPLLDQLASLSTRPIIVMASAPTAEEVIAALRSGVRDFFKKPFPVESLLDSVGSAISAADVRRQHLARYRRMRDLVRHCIKERRGLRQRIELLCIDLVQAQRRLVRRVLAMQEAAER
jgi:DNA-binding response OmpR family regulator